MHKIRCCSQANANKVTAHAGVQRMARIMTIPFLSCTARYSDADYDTARAWAASALAPNDAAAPTMNGNMTHALTHSHPATLVGENAHEFLLVACGGPCCTLHSTREAEEPGLPSPPKGPVAATRRSRGLLMGVALISCPPARWWWQIRNSASCLISQGGICSNGLGDGRFTDAGTLLI